MSRTFLPHVITDDSALGGSVIQRSLRFRSNHSLQRSPSSTTNSTKHTLSFWFKVSKLHNATNQGVLFAGGSDGSYSYVQLWSNTLYFGNSAGPYWNGNFNIRDFNSWYHGVVVIDTTQSTADDRQKFYLNGVQQAKGNAGSNNPNQNDNYEFLTNSSWTYWIGKRALNDMNFMGYMAEINFVQGQALDASHFGYTESQTGIWRPKRYEGTYGDNGFHLDFNDNSSVASLGIDKSPNGNDWSVNGVELDLGTHDDSMIDTPTNNFPTLNPSNRSSGPTLDWGNLYFFYNYKPASKTCRTTFRLPKSGKYYWEWENNESSSNPGRWQSGIINVVNETSTNYDIQGYNDADIVSYSFGGSTWFGTTHTSGSWDGTTRSWYRPQRCAWAVDCDTGNVFLGRVADDATTQWWASDGSATGNPSKLLNPTGQIDKDITHHYLPFISWHDGGAASSTGFAIDINFGQHAFKGTVPDGFKTLSSANIPPDPTLTTIVRPQKHFESLIYTGDQTDGTRSITGLEFTPDFVWLKCRSSATSHNLYDSVRGFGANKEMCTDKSQAEGGEAGSQYGYVNQNNRGFDLVAGSDSTLGSRVYNININNATYVAWCWKAGGAAVSNTDGDITSSVSVNEEAGFSIATYTGSTASGALTVGHGLGKKPAWVMIKRRDSSGEWIIGHQGLTTNAFQNNKFLKFSTNGTFTNSLVFGAEPTTTVTQIVTDGNAGASNLTSSGTYVMYSWAEIPGYSKFGSYTGNGSSDGTFVYLGFRPAYLMIKNQNNGFNWVIQDNKRSPFNLCDNKLNPDSSAAEQTDYDKLDMLSNGFKPRVSDAGINASSSSYVYMAFAERPSGTMFGLDANAR